MPYPSPTARSRLTFELSRQTGLRRKPKGNIAPLHDSRPPDGRGTLNVATAEMPNAANGRTRLGCTVAAEFSRQFSDEVSWMKVDPQAAAAASGEEDITEGGDNQGGGNNNPPSGELEG